jgi:hypothetical protein
MSFTKGPWEFVEGDSNCPEGILRSHSSLGAINELEEGYHIAEIWKDGPWFGERLGEAIANAHLIAAAPELLEALEEMDRLIVIAARVMDKHKIAADEFISTFKDAGLEEKALSRARAAILKAKGR